MPCARAWPSSPKGTRPIEEMEICSGSWAQGLSELPEIGVLHLKWLEPRHMQHQIRRWDKSHEHELAAAWLNGSGILVWENVFGTWNPWNGQDRATLRRMAPVLRAFSPLLAQGDWLPYFPTLAQKAYASCWQGTGVRLWTIVNRSGRRVEGPLLEIDDRGERFFDLWRGVPVAPERAGGKIRLTLGDRSLRSDPGREARTGGVGCGDAARGGSLADLLDAQHKESLRPGSGPRTTCTRPLDRSSSRSRRLDAGGSVLAGPPGC